MNARAKARVGVAKNPPPNKPLLSPPATLQLPDSWKIPPHLDRERYEMSAKLKTASTNYAAAILVGDTNVINAAWHKLEDASRAFRDFELKHMPKR